MGGAFQQRVIEAATVQLAASVTVVGDAGRGGGGSGHRASSAAKPELQGLGVLIDRAAGMVVVFGSRSGVLVGGGPWRIGQVLPEPMVADDRRPRLLEGAVGRLGEMVSVGRGGDVVVEEVLTQAVGRPAEASGNLFRREGEYWTVVFEGSVVRLRDAKGLRHLARPGPPRRARSGSCWSRSWRGRWGWMAGTGRRPRTPSGPG